MTKIIIGGLGLAGCAWNPTPCAESSTTVPRITFEHARIEQPWPCTVPEAEVRARAANIAGVARADPVAVCVVNQAEVACEKLPDAKGPYFRCETAHPLFETQVRFIPSGGDCAISGEGPPD